MSTETLVVGRIKFNEIVTMGVQILVKEKFEAELECEIKRSDTLNEWAFQDANWASHIGDDEIKNVRAILEEWKIYIKKFELSLYYLTEPYVYIRYPDNE